MVTKKRVGQAQERGVSIMDDALIRAYRREFEMVKQAGHAQERRNERLSNIMTRMEQDFNIKIFSNNKGNPALPLYKEIAQARSI